MRKKIIIILMLLFVFLFTTTGCKNKYHKSFDEMNEKFVDAFSNEDDIKTFDVTYLSAVRYEGKYYYLVEYTIENEEKLNELLYVFDKSGKVETFFSVTDFNEIYNDHKDYYDDYNEALENGEYIKYTLKEIKKIINDYYGF